MRVDIYIYIYISTQEGSCARLHVLGQTTDGHFPLQISRSCIVPSMRTSGVSSSSNALLARTCPGAAGRQAGQGRCNSTDRACRRRLLRGQRRNLSTLALWRALLLCSGSSGSGSSGELSGAAALAAALAGDFFGSDGAALWTARGVTASSVASCPTAQLLTLPAAVRCLECLLQESEQATLLARMPSRWARLLQWWRCQVQVRAPAFRWRGGRNHRVLVRHCGPGTLCLNSCEQRRACFSQSAPPTQYSR